MNLLIATVPPVAIPAGDPAALRIAAGRFLAATDALRNHAGRIDRVAAATVGESWAGSASSCFQEACAATTQAAIAAANAFGRIAAALAVLASELEAVQAEATRVAGMAEDLNQRSARLRAQADDPSAHSQGALVGTVVALGAEAARLQIAAGVAQERAQLAVRRAAAEFDQIAAVAPGRGGDPPTGSVSGLVAQLASPTTGAFLSGWPAGRLLASVAGMPSGARRVALWLPAPITGTEPISVPEPDLYRRYDDAVAGWSDHYDISPVLLASVIQHEGQGREKAEQLLRGLFRTVERSRLGSQTVGIGQMRPDLAASLEGISAEEARRRLVDDKEFAIKTAAHHLRRLQLDYGLSDEQAFVAYAFSPASIWKLQANGFDPARLPSDHQMRAELTRRLERYREIRADVERTRIYG
jgi:uncharacterized protein YukE